ncbi:LysR substrate-binding domain-containing protein [Spirochaeta africana]|uniref:Transcriptional regulator n=1 Tax=Spirochaeta africana (strain ATCC 700263 / DSM 8902 / Z-7692) TaxID=889378 RepID=H9UMH7_SPIAZ|nr:LysR substrate-binding domain-containing protein [Spirochaeta africana]AFG38720.1 transcriptional regulator [Spirochaeta africana DSM 8902]
MNLRDLHYFTAVAELGHFGQAAERCCVSQPTLSGQLRKLEEHLGHPLFERTTRSVTLTPFGQEALALARRVIRDCDAIQRKARELDDPYAGPLTLGAFPTIGPWLLPRITPYLSQAFPKTFFYLLEEKSPVLQSQLENEQLDAAILSLPQEHPALTSIPLFSEPFLAAVPEDHPWAERDTLNTVEISGERLLLLADGHCLRDQALELCSLQRIDSEAGFQATSLETLRQMVRLGAGITLVPKLAVPEIPEPGIRYIPLADDSARREIALCFRETHPRERFLQELGSEIRAHYREPLFAAGC